MDSAPERETPARAATRPRVSVALCLTVLNEVSSIDDLLRSIAGQTRRPDEIVVVDGGSSDGTMERLAAWRMSGLPLEILQVPGANISTGRNRAIRRSSAEVIAVTDAGVELAPHWLEALVAPFELAEPPDMVAGFFTPAPRSVFELALGATTLPVEREIRPDRFLPSSRSVAFTSDAWHRVGGYPEWLDYCEDLVFDLALRNAGCRVAWAPRAIARFRPRPSPRAFFAQYFRYARGDGKADLWRQRHAIRYATYLGLPLVLALARRRPWLLPPLLAAMGAYVWRPYTRLAPRLADLKPSARIAAVAWVPIIRLIGDAAKMLGYPLGLIWRARNRDLRWRPSFDHVGPSAQWGRTREPSERHDLPPDGARH